MRSPNFFVSNANAICFRLSAPKKASMSKITIAADAHGATGSIFGGLGDKMMVVPTRSDLCLEMNGCRETRVAV